MVGMGKSGPKENAAPPEGQGNWDVHRPPVRARKRRSAAVSGRKRRRPRRSKNAFWARSGRRILRADACTCQIPKPARGGAAGGGAAAGMPRQTSASGRPGRPRQWISSANSVSGFGSSWSMACRCASISSGSTKRRCSRSPVPAGISRPMMTFSLSPRR